MSRTRAIASVCLYCLMSIGCAASGPSRSDTYVVHPQDTLYGIAWRHHLDYRDLAKWNHVGPDHRLTVGQVLVLGPGRATAATTPADASSTANRVAAPSSAAPKGSAAVSETHGSGGGAPARGRSIGDQSRARTGDGSAGERHSSAADGKHWVWPTDRSSAPRPVPGGGVLLLGRLGQDIRAAAAGRVVYTGSGLRGYGNLIIIKHGDSLLSSYAHNEELLVREGQDVTAGQIIAHMGTGSHQVAALYFEIRVNGKPIDPLRYLPAQ